MSNKITDFSGLFIKIKNSLQQQSLLEAGDSLILAVSGGLDSMVLADFFVWLSYTVDLDLKIAHFNHGLRPGADEKDSNLVKSYAQQQGLLYFEGKEDVLALAQKRKKGIEEAARFARYKFLQELAGSAAKIVLAHHLDDQAETLLLNLGRGAGSKGLAAMRPLEGNLLRPFLEISKSELVNYAQSNELSYLEDESNQSSQFLRNRLRLELLPLWTKLLGYDPSPLLARTARLISLDSSYLEYLSQIAYDKVKLRESLACLEVRKLPEAIQTRVIRLYWQERTGDSSQIEEKHIRAILEQILIPKSSASLDLPAGFRAFFQKDTFLIRGALQ